MRVADNKLESFRDSVQTWHMSVSYPIRDEDVRLFTSAKHNDESSSAAFRKSSGRIRDVSGLGKCEVVGSDLQQNRGEPEYDLSDLSSFFRTTM